jgi:3-methyl-2-oxobutanoate hydroxymethyltransferase
MSGHTTPEKRITAPQLRELKNAGVKISALTAYDFITASLLDASGIDLVLIGDSLGMVFAGDKDTINVSVAQIVYHTKIVSKAVKRALVVADMPFMSYQQSQETALKNAGRLLKAGAQAVKLEGGKSICPTVSALSASGIPVVGHIGLTPQSTHQLGGYPLRGKERSEAEELQQAAVALQTAGAIALVLEKIPAHLAEEISNRLAIPSIGIGAGPHCDGQILVAEDMLGAFPAFKPRFVRRYAEMNEMMRTAFSAYVADVKAGRFPDNSESFS